MSTRAMLSFVVVLAFVSSGCMTWPQEYHYEPVQKSGEGLKVGVEYEVQDVHYQKRTGSSTVRDKSGAAIGAVDHYKDVSETLAYEDWFFAQGEQSIDEADFYRIAGRSDVADRIEQERASAYSSAKTGFWVGTGGGLALLGGVGYGAYVNEPNAIIGYSLLGGGLAALLTGFWLQGDLHKLSDDYAFTSRPTATRVADEYNEQQGTMPPPNPQAPNVDRVVPESDGRDSIKVSSAPPYRVLEMAEQRLDTP